MDWQRVGDTITILTGEGVEFVEEQLMKFVDYMRCQKCGANTWHDALKTGHRCRDCDTFSRYKK